MPLYLNLIQTKQKYMQKSLVIPPKLALLKMLSFYEISCFSQFQQKRKSVWSVLAFDGSHSVIPYSDRNFLSLWQSQNSALVSLLRTCAHLDGFSRDAQASRSLRYTIITENKIFFIENSTLRNRDYSDTPQSQRMTFYQETGHEF